MKQLLIYLLVIFSCPAISQTQVQGKVIDRATREPLELAYVKVVNTNTTAVTDKQGYFNIALRPTDHSDQTDVIYLLYRV